MSEPGRQVGMCAECGEPWDAVCHQVALGHHHFKPVNVTAAAPAQCDHIDTIWDGNWQHPSKCQTCGLETNNPATPSVVVAASLGEQGRAEFQPGPNITGKPVHEWGSVYSEKEELVIEIARELYDRFMMGGWEPQDAYPQIREWMQRVSDPSPAYVAPPDDLKDPTGS